MKLFQTTLFIALLTLTVSSFATGGDFQRVAAPIRGGWELASRYGEDYIHLFPDFETIGAPELKIYISKAPIVTLNDDNALFRSEELGALGNREGEQWLRVPEDVDVKRYQTIFLYSDYFKKLWAVSKIKVDDEAYKQTRRRVYQGRSF